MHLSLKTFGKLHNWWAMGIPILGTIIAIEAIDELSVSSFVPIVHNLFLRDTTHFLTLLFYLFYCWTFHV